MNILMLLNGINDELIENAKIKESEKMKEQAKRKNTWLKLTAIAASLMIIAGSAAILMHQNKMTSTANNYVIKDGILMKYTGNETELTIPDNVSTISSSAFKDNPGAASVTLLTTKTVKVEEGALTPLVKLSSVKVTDANEENFVKFADSILSSNVEDLISAGIGLEYEYSENGATPVYRIPNIDGIKLVFGSGYLDNPLSESQSPTKIILSKENLKLSSGIFVGMTSSDAKAVNIEWSDIYFNTDSMYYFTVANIGNGKYTFAWSMTEDQYNQWLRTIEFNDNFSSAPEKYLKPYLEENIGNVKEIIIERIEKPDGIS